MPKDFEDELFMQKLTAETHASIKLMTLGCDNACFTKKLAIKPSNFAGFMAKKI